MIPRCGGVRSPFGHAGLSSNFGWQAGGFEKFAFDHLRI